MGDGSRYFAYGAHVPRRPIWKLDPGRPAKRVARLPDHRLTFTRRPSCDGGLASLEPSPGMSVYGVLYEVDDRCWANFDKRWGESYERRPAAVEIQGKLVSCYTYFARNQASAESPPSSAYLKSICKAAHKGGLPSQYIDFLATITSASQAGGGTRGRAGDDDTLRLAATQDRRNSHGMPLVRLNRGDAKRAGIKRYCAIKLTGHAREGSTTGNEATAHRRQAIARVEHCKPEDVPSGTCQADQSLRNCLGISGLYCHGELVSVAAVGGRLPARSPIQPRALVLPLHSLSRRDTEKNYCVLHPELIKALGLAEGEYVRIYAVAATGKNTPAGAVVKKLHVEAITLRVFAGIGPYVERAGVKVPYPQSSEIYIDQDGRQALGLETPVEAWLDTPILVRPALRQAFLGRSIFYGITVFVGIDAFAFLLDHFFDHLGGWLLALVSVVAAFVVTGILSFFDLRGRLRY
jgi:AIG2-like family